MSSGPIRWSSSSAIARQRNRPADGVYGTLSAVSTALVTGFPGFLGSRLVSALREKAPDLRVVALVEPRMEQLARDRAPEGVEVLPGDIAERRLGLGDESYGRLAAE